MDHYFRYGAIRQRLHVGPLSAYLDAFARQLSEYGYAIDTGQQQLRVVSHLSQWMGRRGLQAPDLSESVLKCFLADRRRQGRLRNTDPRALGWFLEHLRQAGVVERTPPLGAEEYLGLRRALGFKLHDVGQALARFLAFCEDQGAAVVTADLALRWAVSADASPARAAWRLRIVRDFAVHHQASDPRTEIPPKDLFPSRRHRKTPYLYSDEEVAQLLQVARELPPGKGLRHRTYATLFGLLAATGLRVGEALALDGADVVWQAGMLVVRQSKFRQSRLVPVHASTLDRLRRYQEERDRIYPRPKTSAFFVSESGRRLPYRTVQGVFRRLREQLRLRGASTSRRPRIHDLRHRFAVNTLIRWYREGADVERCLPRLSTYLGHGRCEHTYWYLTAVPELLRLATERLEQKGVHDEK